MYNHISDPWVDFQSMYNLCGPLLAATCRSRFETPTQGTTYVGQHVAMVLVRLFVMASVEKDEQAAK